MEHVVSGGSNEYIPRHVNVCLKFEYSESEAWNDFKIKASTTDLVKSGNGANTYLYCFRNFQSQYEPKMVPRYIPPHKRKEIEHKKSYGSTKRNSYEVCKNKKQY